MTADIADGDMAGDVAGAVTLTEAQEGIWYASQADPTHPGYNTAHAVELRGALDVPRFARAIERALAEAPGLQVQIIDTLDGPRQVMHAQVPVLDVVDLASQADPHAVAMMAIRADMDRARALDRDALVVQRLYVLGPAHWLWYQGVHHILIDGYGTLLLMRRISEWYDRGDDEPTGMTMGRIVDVQADDARYRAGALRERDRRYWHEQFVRLPEITSLSASRAPAARAAHMASAALPATVIEAVQAVAEEAEVPWPDVLVTLVAAYLTRHTGSEEIVIGVPYMGRLGTPAARVPTMTMNVLPMRLVIDESQEMRALVADVSDRLRMARKHGRYRSEQLRRDLHLIGGDRHVHGPIVNVLPFEEAVTLRGVQSNHLVLGTGPVDDLAIAVRGGAPSRDVPGTVARLEFEANPDRYSVAEVDAHLTRLSTFLQRAVQAHTLASVPTLTDTEHQQWVHTVNDTAHVVPSVTLIDLIDDAMRRAPDAPALRADGRTVTYAQLDTLVTAAAVSLASAGVQRGDVVALAIPRSLDLSVVMLAVLRVGAAYMPIESDQPIERVDVMMREAKPRLLVASAAFASTLPDALPQLQVQDGVIAVPSAQARADARPERPGCSDAAYVIFTSGSTGVPKGVVVEHAAIVNRLEWMRTHYGIGATDRILQKTPVTFDVSVWELFLPFMAGATLVMAPPASHRDPAWLARVIDDEGITVTHFVPSMLSAFLAEQEGAPRPVSSLRQVFCSGEALTAEQRDRFHGLYAAELHNLYGPTEAAVDVTYWPASRDDRSDPVPIGFPVWNTAMYVLDARLRPVPPGVAGDLYIAGVQLARGYLNRPEFTAERFIADPFVSGARMYLTGDKAMWRADGALTYLGRSDHQVKIRGVRIEPGEIESAIMSIGGYAQAHVVPRVMPDGETRLVAYVMPAIGANSPDADGLRALLQTRLPEAMVPSYVMAVDTVPLTSSGKLDRKALPMPEHIVGAGRSLSTATEHQVAALFAELLQLDVTTLHADDDFFLLGGHSLLAARVMVRLRAERQLSAGIGALFANPTVSRFARYLDEALPLRAHERAQAEGLGTVVLLADGVRDGVAPHHAPLFCIHPAGGISWCYAALGRVMMQPRAVYGLQADLLGGAQPSTLRDMASTYVQRVREIQPAGPYHLAGWSVGGIIAQEMAVQLQEAGAAVGVVALLDAYPADHWRLAPPPADGAALDALLLIAGIDPASFAQADRNLESVICLLRHTGHPLGTLSDDTLAGVLRVVESNNRLVRGHVQRRFDGTLLHLRAALDHGDGSYLATEWEPYAQTIDAHDIPSLHAHMTSPEHAPRIAALMHAGLQPLTVVVQ
ncbi:enterobactin synthase subunit F [Gemmatimonas aurantiaca]|nr:enterobactin synthase subunit F [Gemmatimonas aurantiaca]